MKKYTALFFVLLISQNVLSQQLHQIKKPAASAAMPTWAELLYNGTTNVFEIDKAFTDFYHKNKFEKNIYTRYYKKWRYAIQPFIKPNGFIDSTQIGKQELANLSFTRKGARMAEGSPWKPLGPFRVVNNEASSNNLNHLNIYYVEIAPSNTNVVYCGAEGGGIFKTLDKGLNWAPVAPIDVNVLTGPMAIHPADENTVYIANTNYIIKTTDGGASWQVLHTFEFGSYPEDIEIDPVNPNNIFVATAFGLWKSTDAGLNWTLAEQRGIYSLSLEPGNPQNILMFAADNGDYFIFKSTDGGVSFVKKDLGWHFGSSMAGLVKHAPSNPNIVYAISHERLLSRIFLMKSTDAGETWAMLNDVDTSHQGFYDLILDVNPINPDHVITGTLVPKVSTDGGVNFQNIPRPVHVDQQQLVSVGGESWLANDGGLVYSTDFFATFENASIRSNGLYENEFWGFAQGWNVDIIGGGRYHNGNVYISENVEPGTGIMQGGSEEGTGYITMNNENAVLFSSYNNVGYSKFPDEDGYGFFAAELETDPTISTTHYLGSENFLWKSIDAGITYQKVPSNDGAVDFGSKVKQIEIFRQNPQIIYVGATDGLFKTLDGGQSWITIPRPAGIEGTLYSTLSLSFTNSDSLWANFGNRIFLTADGGLNWTEMMSEVLPTDPLIRQVIHQAGTDGGFYVLASPSKVFYKDNTLSDFVDYSNNLPAHFDLLRGGIFYRDGKLRISGTKGIWEVPLYTVSKPVAQIMVDYKTLGCTRKTANFKTFSVADKNAQFEWAFEGGSPANSTEKFPSVTYQTSGKYDVQLKITNPDGSTSIQNFAEFIHFDLTECTPKCAAGQMLETNNLSFIKAKIPTALGNSNSLTVSVWVMPLKLEPGMKQAILSNSMINFGLFIDSESLEVKSLFGTETASGLKLKPLKYSNITWVISPNEVTFYVNGQKAVFAKNNAPINFGFDFTLGLGWEGEHLPFGSIAQNFVGYIDEVKIFSRAISESELPMASSILTENVPDLVTYFQFNERDPFLFVDQVSGEIFEAKDLSNRQLKGPSLVPTHCYPIVENCIKCIEFKTLKLKTP